MKKQAFGKLYKELFCIPKHEKLPDKVFRCRMVLSLLTILACTAVMAASTFALFYMDVSTDNSTIASAYYSVRIENAENGTYICPLAFEDKHTFEIKADGTATTGYCKIQVGENIYYTEQISKGQSIVLTVQAARGTLITFTPQWGPSSDIDNISVCGRSISHSETSYAVCQVGANITIAELSAYYNVPESDILIYNNTTEIAADMTIKIPGVSSDTPPYLSPTAGAEGAKT